MKTKIPMLIISLILTVLLCGCNQYSIQYAVYDTPIYGTYSKTLKNETQTLSLFDDSTYKYVRYQEYDPKTEYHVEGSFHAEVVNADITKIVLSDLNRESVGDIRYSFSNGNIIYKYKNLIGYYIKEPINTKSSFIIHSHYDSDSYFEFNGKGTAQAKYNGKESADEIAYEIKDNIIWVDFAGTGEYEPFYYIVCDGVFIAIPSYCMIKD